MSAEIICDDALKWLARQETIPNVLTGICDLDEISMDMDNYIKFFVKIARLIFERLDDRGYAIFIQTDRKYNRSWVDKSYILTSIAREYGLKTIWHKIVLHRGVDRTDLHRPTYAHMLCFSKKGTTGAATPDVIPVSKKLYKNATPPEAAKRGLEFIKRYASIKKVVDPFVGQGTIPAIAQSLGLDSIGVDIDPKQCEKARKILD